MKHSTPRRGGLAGVVAGCLLALATVGGTFAASPAASATSAARPGTACAPERMAVKADPTAVHLIALGDCQVTRRFVTVDRLESTITAAPYLTAGDRSTLLADVASTRSGLQGLKSTIDAETTVAALRIDLRKIATDYRVYLLIVPQVHLTRGADAESAAAGRLTTLAGRLQQLIDQAAARGKDVTAAKAALAAMSADVANAEAQLTGLSARILALTPADWNSGAAAPVLTTARASGRSVRAELVAARDEARAVVAALR